MLFPLVAAFPFLRDIHKTNVKLFSLDRNIDSTDPSHFAVTVERVDTLVDTDLHRPVAARIQNVLLKFDVNTDGQVTVNDVPVAMGMTRVKIKAKTWMGGNSALVDIKKAISSFDVGIVDVAVHVQGLQVTHDGIAVRKLIVAEEIFEIDGVKMVQNVMMQQVLEVMNDGSVKRQLPCHAPAQLQRQGSMPQEYQHHMERLPSWARYLAIFVHSLFATLVLLFIANAICSGARFIVRFFKNRYQRVPDAEDASEDMKKELKSDAVKEEESLPKYEQQ